MAEGAERDRLMERLSEFRGCSPRTFDGENVDHWIVEKWLLHMEKLFRDIFVEERTECGSPLTFWTARPTVGSWISRTTPTPTWQRLLGLGSRSFFWRTTFLPASRGRWSRICAACARMSGQWLNALTEAAEASQEPEPVAGPWPVYPARRTRSSPGPLLRDLWRSSLPAAVFAQPGQVLLVWSGGPLPVGLPEESIASAIFGICTSIARSQSGDIFCASLGRAAASSATGGGVTTAPRGRMYAAQIEEAAAAENVVADIREFCPSCPVRIGDWIMHVDLLALHKLGEFDVVFGMDWLTKYFATIDCKNRTVTFREPGQAEVVYRGCQSSLFAMTISSSRARQLISRGCVAYLATVVLRVWTAPLGLRISP
uniref:Uncharacterized protein n=1 Tax=Ananas comosus var. bracteatus TaxID=296719 RepID=A0A6V7QBI8_ANACO|nr:unnamed protein product [Ananas comosus var. bracteatus]